MEKKYLLAGVMATASVLGGMDAAMASDLNTLSEAAGQAWEQRDAMTGVYFVVGLLGFLLMWGAFIGFAIGAAVAVGWFMWKARWVVGSLFVLGLIAIMFGMAN